MEGFSEIVYSLMPWAIGLILLVCVAIVILKIRLHIIESKPKEEKENVISVDGVIKK